ncbi:pyridoxal-dependent decarboxylase [uncultured Kordia sp.]|uniref:pyridoxal phosphate-dependent decarboxylase family protein n=1 Tax=uncultured Kordia sp. TaxID=507699 RepID=UPI0026232403|nr:pyridoxal-dependent decarboxylase [uncultured Kordia sp.]
MYKKLASDKENIALLLNEVKQVAMQHFQEIETVPASAKPRELKNYKLPKEGLGAEAVLAHFKTEYQQLMCGSSGPRYWGYVTGGATPASVMGDWLATTFDQNTQSIKGRGDVSGIMEKETIQLLLEFFNLPKTFYGGFVTGATMSNFTCLGVARQWVGKNQDYDVALTGLQKPIQVAAGMPHSSVVKGLSMLGIGSTNIHKIPLLEGREAINVEKLEAFLKQNPTGDVIVLSSAGTVNSVDFDDLEAISKLKEIYNFWWHIDAAFGGMVACVEDKKQLISGWKKADSITVDCHKWLNIPYDSAVFFVQEKHQKRQVETYQNSNAPYLGNPMENFTYLNFLPENSRRFRALPVWFSLMAYGKKGHQEIVTRNIDLAQQLANYIETSKDFQLVAPTRVNVVCFKVVGLSQEKQDLFLTTLNSRRKIFITPSVYNGEACFRAAFVNWQTTQKDIAIAIKELEATFQIIKEMKS